MKVIVILHNIRSNGNVGSIFRTADAAGVSKIFLAGYTPTPVDKFGRKNKALAKAALGAEQFIEWEKVKNLRGIIKRLKIEKFKVIAIEQDSRSINYKKIKKTGKMVFVFGNEVKGLSKKDLEFCEFVAEIPMQGKKESLNVSVAAGIMLFNTLSN